MTLDTTLQKFMSNTQRSKVAVIVPLYGYWNDIEDSFLNLDTLKFTMDRIQSSVHQLYVFFVGEPARVPMEIQNYIVGYQMGGNSSSVSVPSHSSYGDYIREGLSAAYDSTESAYFVNVNPWLLMQEIGIDVLVDRLNMSDDAKIVSGFDLRPTIDPDTFNPVQFEQFFFQTPKEDRKMDCNLFGITRYMLEMCPPDPNIKTSFYLERDMWQLMFAKGYEVITSQRIPMFVFDVSLLSIENPVDVETDKAYFQSKWGFIPEK